MGFFFFWSYRLYRKKICAAQTFHTVYYICYFVTVVFLTGLVTSEYTDVAESAVSGRDYTHLDTLVEFGNGEPYQSVFISIINDEYREPHEAFVVTLSECTNGALTQPSVAYVAIIDDDETDGMIFS